MTLRRTLRSPNGMALPAALGAMCVLAALAALASFSARLAVREAAALHMEAKSEAARDALRARVTLALARRERATLLAGPVALGGGDTLLRVSALSWPWHRVSVAAGGTAVIAEVAGVNVPPVWCAAVVSGDVTTGALGTIALSPASACASALATVPADSITAFALTLARTLVLPLLADSVTYTAAGAGPQVIRAARRVMLGGGAVVSGVVIAPSVHVSSGAVVRGVVIAADTVVVEAGASIVGDEVAVAAALASFARLRLAGRRGLLLPP